MLLHKLYSEPDGLFQPIEFKNGVNFIFAKKDKATDNRQSLNGVGKSLLLNFLDYALLSSETKHIQVARKNNNLDDYHVVLEFKVNDIMYIIKRPFKTPKKNILFGEKDGELVSYDLPKAIIDRELTRFVCDLTFKNSNYRGVYFDTWLRQLMPFFIKKQENPKTKVNFADPIKYIDKLTEMEQVPYHLFFMGIDNTLFYKNLDAQRELKAKTPVLQEVTTYIQETYRLDDISQAENEIDRLKSQVTAFEKNIEKFQLAEQYKDIEVQCNELTTEIKALWYQNHLDGEKIKSYKESYTLGDSIKSEKIRNLYKDLNELLAENIKKTLDEAIEFRKNIADSRKDFLSSEISLLEKGISEKVAAIATLEEKRANLFSILEAKEAIKDLSEAYLALSRKREQLGDLDGKIKIYRDLNRYLADKKAELTQLYSKIVAFIQENKDSITNFRNIFFNVHNAIYPENKNQSFGFTFDANQRKDSMVDMSVYLPANLSYGKNKGCTLIYDLSILFHAIDKGLNLPRFLVHDGIFDGMDKAHFICLYEFLEKQSSEGKSFQYIITVNEEGTLSENFGNTDKVTPEKIEQEAIITLTPSKKLLNNDWE